MYESFFGLKEKPFSLLPDPDFLFMSSKHSLALSILEYSLAGQAGFCAITGDIGSGKTTLIRMLLRRIGRDITLGLISNTHSGLTDITAWALAAFGRGSNAQSDAEIYQELMHFLIERIRRRAALRPHRRRGAEPDGRRAGGAAPAVQHQLGQGSAAADHPGRDSRNCW